MRCHRARQRQLRGSEVGSLTALLSITCHVPQNAIYAFHGVLFLKGWKIPETVQHNRAAGLASRVSCTRNAVFENRGMNEALNKAEEITSGFSALTHRP